MAGLKRHSWDKTVPIARYRPRLIQDSDEPVPSPVHALRGELEVLQTAVDTLQAEHDRYPAAIRFMLVIGIPALLWCLILRAAGVL